MRACLAVLVTMLLSAPANATVRYADNTLPANCTSGNYSIANRSCTGTDGNAYNTPAGVIAPTVAGDEIIVRGGTWTQQWDFQAGNKTGTAGNYITMRGYPGERPVLQYDDTAGSGSGYGPIKARGDRGYFLFEDLVVDGALSRQSSNWGIRDGNHHFIVRNVEIKNFYGSGLTMKSASNVTIENCDIHDQRFTSVSSNHYGIYVAGDTSNIVIEKNRIYNNTGAGIHGYPGPVNGLTIRANRIYANGNNPLIAPAAGGIILYESTVPGSTYANVQIYGNVIYENGLSGVGDGPDGIEINGADNVQIWHNVIYQNKGYGINLHNGTTTPVGTVVQNNIIAANTVGQVRNAGSGTTLSYNACLAGDSCGSTGKVTLSTATEPFLNAGADDYRLKQGTNAVRNAGVATLARPSPVGVSDVGAYEQGVVTAAVMSGGYLELVVSVMTPGVIPVSAITGITVACGGASPCTGSPSVVSANIKPGSNNVIQVALSGITSPGTGTVSMGATNATDSLMVGGSTGSAQGLNSISAMTVTGDLANTTGIGVPTATWSRFLLDEGSGTTANDSTGNGNHGTVSAGVTWVSDISGTGVTIPTDATYRHVSSSLGASMEPSTQDFSICAYVRPTLTGNSQAVVISSGSNGVNQRWYAGWYTVAGQPQWGIGVQGSAFTTGSEFVVSESLTLVCMVNDSTADTVTLWINGVKGGTAGKSVKPITSPYFLTGNLRVGNDGTNTANNGGFTVYDILVWNSKASDTDIADYYAVVAPGGTSEGYKQSQLQWEHVYTNSALSPQVVTPKADGSIDVVVNGGAAFRVQYDCTGGDCAQIAPRLYYSTNGTDYNLAVPQVLGSDGIAAWGDDTDVYFNGGVSSGCINSTGLTPTSGVTIADAVAGQTFALGEDHCRTDRYVVKVGNVPNTSFWFQVKTDAGQRFANYPQVIKLNVIPMQANMGF